MILPSLSMRMYSLLIVSLSSDNVFDHDLLQDAIALVVDADAPRVNDFDRGLGALLALDGPVHAVEQRHVAPVLRPIAGIAHRQLAISADLLLMYAEKYAIGTALPTTLMMRPRRRAIIAAITA